MAEMRTLGLRLLIITAVTALLLGLTQMITEKPIEKQRAAAALESRMAVLPQADGFVEVDLSNMTYAVGALPDKVELAEVYQGRRLGEKDPIGYTIKLTTVGYGGRFPVTVGIDAGGNITGVSVDSSGETAGLGANAGKPEFTGQFVGMHAFETLTIQPDGVMGQKVRAITSATITSSAVVRAINGSLQIFHAVSD